MACAIFYSHAEKIPLFLLFYHYILKQNPVYYRSLDVKSALIYFFYMFLIIWSQNFSTVITTSILFFSKKIEVKNMPDTLLIFALHRETNKSLYGDDFHSVVIKAGALFYPSLNCS